MNQLWSSLPDVFNAISIIGFCVLVLLFILVITSVDED